MTPDAGRAFVIAGLMMLEFYFFLLVGLAWVIFFTAKFIISLGQNDGRPLAKTWEWIKAVVDVISQIG